MSNWCVTQSARDAGAEVLNGGLALDYARVKVSKRQKSIRLVHGSGFVCVRGC